jgi:hypothetical protein
MTRLIRALTLCLALSSTAGFTQAADASSKIKHSFLATGGHTRIVSEDGTDTWNYPNSTRDGWVLKNGNLLLAVSKGKEFPGGGIVELTPSGEVKAKWQGTQDEVNTVVALPKGGYMVTEAGAKPRILELDKDLKITLEVPIQCQVTNFHMQTRMSRRLDNGNFLVPHLLDKVVREYDRTGKIVWEAKTPNWAFTAIRLPNGNTLVGCTYGNVVVEFNPKSEIVWQVSNDDLPGRPIKDACGVQRLPNGNTVITSYGSKAGEIRMTEVNRDKQIVWTYTDNQPSGIHHFQILTTNGKKVKKFWR